MLTIRCDRTRTRLPAGVRHTRFAFEDAGAEVDAALVLVEVGAGEQQRLVVDVQLHQLGVGHVDDGLARLGEPERVLGVLDRPGLVEAVEVRAVAVRLAALLRVRPHPEVAVAEGEERLGQAEVVVAVLALDEPPRLDREAVLGEPGRDGMVVHGATIGRSRPIGGSNRRHCIRQQFGQVVDHDVGAVGEQRVVTGAPVDADHHCEVSGGARGDARHGVLDDDRLRARRHRATRRRAGRRRVPACPAGPVPPTSMPSTTTSKRALRPAASRTGRAFFDDDTIAAGTPSCSSRSRVAATPGVRRDALAVEDLVEQRVLAVAEGAHGVGRRADRRAVRRAA